MLDSASQQHPPDPVRSETGTPTVHGRAQGAGAIASLFASIYTDLEHIASGLLSHERTGHTLGTHGVLHEAYWRVLRTYSDSELADGVDSDSVRAITAKVMRHVLVDHARSRNARHRAVSGYGEVLAGSTAEVTPMVVDLLALDEALQSLARQDPRKSTVVELRFFGGMPMPRIANVLGTSLRSVERDWAFARAWLAARVRGESTDAE